MVETTQSPLAMLVLVTPYTILYLINQVFMAGILDKMHYLFFELIFVLAFRKVFGIPDLTEKFFSSNKESKEEDLQEPKPAAGLQPLKTHVVETTVDPHPKKQPQEMQQPPRETMNMDSTQQFKASTTTTTTTTTTSNIQKLLPYAKEVAAMEKKFMDYVENTTIWEKVHEERSPGLIQVFQYKERPMCYKILATMNNTAAVTFDMLCDLDQRTVWDPMCVEAKVLERPGEEDGSGLSIQYIRTKGVWPTASRDTVVLGMVKDLEGDNMTDRKASASASVAAATVRRNTRLCSVTTNLEYAGMPERTEEKIVRMETAVAGYIVEGQEGEAQCRLVQILDADLKGWIPEKVIQKVSTKAVPEGIRTVNSLIPKMEPYHESRVLAAVTRMRMEATESILNKGLDPMDADPEDRALDGVGQEEEEEEEERTKKENKHELKHKRESSMSLAVLSDRLKAVETEVGIRARHSSMSNTKGKASSSGGGGGAATTTGTLEKKQQKAGSKTGILSVFWEGVKENLGFTSTSHGGGLSTINKIVVAVIVVAVLGSTVAAKIRRR